MASQTNFPPTSGLETVHHIIATVQTIRIGVITPMKHVKIAWFVCGEIGK